MISFALLGTAAGVATGLTPGLHVNTVAAFILAFQGLFLALAGSLFAGASPTSPDLILLVAALVVGMVIAHTFLDYVPSIFLGAPEAETALSVLPGHRMLLQGRAVEAIRLSARGSLIATFLALLLVLPFRLVMGTPVDAYGDLRRAIPSLLLLVAAMLIISEPGHSRERPRSLVCRLPEGLLGRGETRPEILALPPSEVGDSQEAFLLQGVVTVHESRAVVVSDKRASVRVRLEGEPPAPLQGAVSLFVAPGEIRSRFAVLVPKGWGTSVFLLSGLLGSLVLLTPALATNWFPIPGLQADPRNLGFLPLFTGLFALPALLISLARTPAVPPQEIAPQPSPLSPRTQVRAALGGSLAGAFVAWIPGVTAATATIFSQLLSGNRSRRERNDEEFILSISCVNTATAIFTILALFVILRARSGGAAALLALAEDLVVVWDPVLRFPPALAWLLLAVVVAAVLAFFLTRGFGVLFARLAGALPYRRIVLGVLLFLVGVILLFSGATGLLVAMAATLIGLVPPLVGVRRVHLMGCLILPLILLLA